MIEEARDSTDALVGRFVRSKAKAVSGDGPPGPRPLWKAASVGPALLINILSTWMLLLLSASSQASPGARQINPRLGLRSNQNRLPSLCASLVGLDGVLRITKVSSSHRPDSHWSIGKVRLRIDNSVRGKGRCGLPSGSQASSPQESCTSSSESTLRLLISLPRLEHERCCQ